MKASETSQFIAAAMKVGRDEAAQRFLHKLDNDKDVGKVRDWKCMYGGCAAAVSDLACASRCTCAAAISVLACGCIHRRGCYISYLRCVM